MKFNFIGGPWFVYSTIDDSGDRPFYEYKIWAFPHGTKVGPIGICDSLMRPYDAKAISAVPEMVDALIDCYKHIKNDMTVAGLITKTKEALEKATGMTIDEIMREDEYGNL